MDRVILGPFLGSQLTASDDLLEICDESGQTIGYFVPAASRDPSWRQWAESAISVEELDRRRAEPGGRTTAEVLRRLESL